MKKDLTLQENDYDWTMVIRPTRGFFDLRLGELWRARELIMLFVWRDFVSANKQTVLGPLWYLIQPIVATIAFTVIFGQVAQLPTDGLPDFLFYNAGTLIFSYFSQCLNKTSTTFTSNASLFGKVYFPRLSVPVSMLISSLVAFFIQFGLFLAFMLYFGLSGAAIHPNAGILLLPLLLLIEAGLGLGIGLIFSALTIRYRDLRYVVGYLIQILMYASPVIFPLSFIPETYRIAILANPLTSIVLTFRYAFLGSGTFEPVYLLYSGGIMLVLLCIGVVMFNKVENTFVDTV